MHVFAERVSAKEKEGATLSLPPSELLSQSYQIKHIELISLRYRNKEIPLPGTVFLCLMARVICEGLF